VGRGVKKFMKFEGRFVKNSRVGPKNFKKLLLHNQSLKGIEINKILIPIY
jgi:hypothetical protein